MSAADATRTELTTARRLRELRELYCHWTAQTLSLRFDREGSGMSSSAPASVLQI
jgi:hypothetical protein